MWHLKTTTMPVIVRVLSISKKGIDKHINKISGSPSLYEIQRFVLCGIFYLVRRVLSMCLKNVTQKRKPKHQYTE